MNEALIFFTKEDWDGSDQPVRIKNSEVPFVLNPHEWILGRIEELLELENNWDGYSAISVVPEVGENAKNFIRMIDGEVIEKISDIFPNAHGTITIEWENNLKEKLSLEIGQNNYSYFVHYQNNDPEFFDGTGIPDNKKIGHKISSLFEAKQTAI